jgi:hypothetical protein
MLTTMNSIRFGAFVMHRILRDFDLEESRLEI